MPRISPRRHVGFTVLAFFAVACKSTPPPPLPVNVTPGSTLRVLIPIDVSPGETDFYFQDATRRLRLQDLDAVNVYCRFTPPASAISNSMVNAGTYTVDTLEYDNNEKGPRNRLVPAVIYVLQGSKPGAVAHLTCAVPDVAATSQFPTAVEISAALGAYFEFKVAR